MTVLEAIKKRRSVRSYDSRPIPDDVMARMCQALRLAPSACNLQPWRFVLVSDPEMKRKLAGAARNQNFMDEAPAIVVGCGLPQEAYKHMGGYGNSADVDVTIALDHLTLAAVEEGLGTCWIGAFDEREVKGLLGVPASVKVVAMTPLGYPSKPGLIHPVEESKRKPVSEVVTLEKFNA